MLEEVVLYPIYRPQVLKAPGTTYDSKKQAQVLAFPHEWARRPHAANGEPLCPWLPSHPPLVNIVRRKFMVQIPSSVCILGVVLEECQEGGGGRIKSLTKVTLIPLDREENGLLAWKV